MYGELVRGRSGDPIEVTICEACDTFERKHGQRAEIVRINSDNPASVEAPEGVELEFVAYVRPGHAWAGRVSE